MSRDVGLNRETPGRSARLTDLVLRIYEEGRRGSEAMSWERLAELVQPANKQARVHDFGPFKAMHLLWNMYLCGDLSFVEVSDKWCMPKAQISDRATTSVANHFEGVRVNELAVSPATKKRKHSGSSARASNKSQKRQESYVFPHAAGQVNQR